MGSRRGRFCAEQTERSQAIRRSDISCLHFDGKKALEWDDDTFKDAGKVGVWTKADSVTLFDDFTYGGQ